MQITLKTLQQQTIQIEIDPEQTVSLLTFANVSRRYMERDMC